MSKSFSRIHPFSFHEDWGNRDREKSGDANADTPREAAAMPDHSLDDPPYPPKTTHSNTRIESTPSGEIPPGGARDCVHICQQFRVRQDILCDIRTVPLRSIQPSVSVRLTCPRQTVPHYRIRVFKSPSESTRTSVFAFYAQISGLTGLLWTSPLSR